MISSLEGPMAECLRMVENTTGQERSTPEDGSSAFASDQEEESPPTFDDTEAEENVRESASVSTQNRCHICRKMVSDRYIYELGRHSALFAHFDCLKCLVCKEQLDENEFCRIRFRKLACRRHYAQLQGLRPTCHNCDEPIDIQAPFVPLKSQGLAFHVACFRCACCQNQLTRGDQFVVRDGFQVLCRSCLERVTEGESQTGKRPRTQISHVNQQILLGSYEANKKPSKAMRLQLARRTGLTQRVIQVWFQNKRAKEKKLAKEEEQRRNNCTHGLRCMCHSCSTMRAWHTWPVGPATFDVPNAQNTESEPGVGFGPQPSSGPDLTQLGSCTQSSGSPEFLPQVGFASLSPTMLSSCPSARFGPDTLVGQFPYPVV